MAAERHRHFVEAYLEDPCATRAHRRAGYRSSGARPANVGYLMRRPEIRAAIEEGQRRYLQAIERDVELIVAELARVAFANIDDVLRLDAEGRVRIDVEAARGHGGLALLRVDDTPCRRRGRKRLRRVVIRLADKLAALDALARHLGLFAA